MRALSLCILLALPACATVSRARCAQNPGSAAPGERTPTAAELGLPVKGQVTLPQVVTTAVRVHPSVVGARHAAEAAHARIIQAEAARYPQVSIGSGTDYVNGTSGEQQRYAPLGIDVSWLLFDFGRTAAFGRQAAEQWLAAQADVKTAEVDAALLVRVAYFELQKQIDLLATNREEVRQFQDHLDQIREQVKAGIKGRVPYDVTKAEVDLGNAKLAEVESRDAVATAQATLATAVGLAEVLDWSPSPGARTLPTPESFDTAWAIARRREPTLVAAMARERAASALIDARVAALYPGLSLGVAFSKSGTELPLPWNLTVGPGIQWTPFDGFQNLSSIDEAVASLRESRSDGAAAEQRAWLGVRTAWLAMEGARERLDLTALTVRSAEEGLVLAQGRFDAGLGTSVDLTDARTALFQAKSARIQAQADLAIAAARLLKALGVSVRES